MPTRTSGHDRARAIAAVALLHAAAGYALIRGLEVDVTRAAGDALQVFDLPALMPPPPPPPEPPALERASAAAEEGAAAPPALKARPKPIAAPEPRVRLPAKPPIAAPKVAADGVETTSGAASMPGPGAGAGGQGNGTGAGGSGTGPGGVGTGDGAGNGQRTPARLLSGQITRRDYPRSAWREGLQRRVSVGFTVGPDGRASACRVTASSGNPRVDAVTCRVIEVSFRYDPARNGRGEPVPAEMAWTQVLWTERD